MRPVSDAFLRTLTGSHQPVFRATVCEAYQSTVTPTGTGIGITDGAVTLDGTAQVRSTVDFATPGEGMWPAAVGDLLVPYGNEVYLERGIAYSDDLVEYVGLGYFRIDTPEQKRAPDGPIRITGRDRMAGILDARLIDPIQFAATATYGQVLATLVSQVYPDVVIEWDDAADTVVIGRPLLAEEDRYRFLDDDIVRPLGKIWYFDHRGVLVVRSLPSVDTPVWSVHLGEGGALLSLARRLTRLGVYNAVVATGEAADTTLPVRGVAYDDNPASPTYFYGRFGPVPRFYSSPTLADANQAKSAAAAQLRRGLGLPHSLDLTAVPNPALEPYDPVLARAASGEAAATHMVERLVVPLTASGALTATTREQTVIHIGLR